MNSREWEAMIRERNKNKKGEVDMPAVSKKQRRAMAIAEHNPGKLHKKNKGMEKMSKNQLSDFASTKESGLPMKKKGKKTGTFISKKGVAKAKGVTNKTKGGGAESIKAFISRRNKETGKGR